MSSEGAARHHRIVDTVSAWPGVATAPGRFGETDFLVDGRSIGHVHGGAQADIPYPRRIRDQLVGEGRTGPHHLHADSGWTTLYIQDEADADAAIELLRINYDRITARASERRPHR